MKSMLKLATGSVVFLNLVACNAAETAKGKPIELKTKNDSISYMIGQDIGDSYKSYRKCHERSTCSDHR